MKTLIVYAHPATPGHCPEILKQVLAYHKEHHISYDLLDLYKMKYDPVMHENEHYTSGGYTISQLNKKIQKMIEGTDKLIFVYPVWWNSMPAILKGFVDKVFTNRWAYMFKPFPIIGGYPIPLLKGKKAAVFLTTGSPKLIWWLYLYRTAARQVKVDMLGFFGIKAKVYHLAGCRKLDEKKLEKLKKLAVRGMRNFYSK